MNRALPALRLPPPDLTINEAGEVFDAVRSIWVALTPEEWVRLHAVEFLRTQARVPASLMAVEKGHAGHAGIRRTDVTVYDRQGLPWLIMECKAPSVPVSQATLAQVLRYAKVLKPSFVAVTNGVRLYAAAVDSSGACRFLPEFPLFPDPVLDGASE